MAADDLQQKVSVAGVAGQIAILIEAEGIGGLSLPLVGGALLLGAFSTVLAMRRNHAQNSIIVEDALGAFLAGAIAGFVSDELLLAARTGFAK